MPLSKPLALLVEIKEKLDDGSLALMFGSPGKNRGNLQSRTYIDRCRTCSDKLPAMNHSFVGFWTFTWHQEPYRNVAHAADDRMTPGSLVSGSS